jgi:ATP-binding cassette subfamily B protein RaxB
MAIAAAIHDDIFGMPMGYETLVGDMGAALSGGQKQRVLLARALYKQLRLLILDEATSHLDGRSEERVLRALEQLQITRIVSAHRSGAIAASTKRIFIADGQIESVPREVASIHGAMAPVS